RSRWGWLLRHVFTSAFGASARRGSPNVGLRGLRPASWTSSTPAPRRRGHLPAVWRTYALARGHDRADRHRTIARQARPRAAASSPAARTRAARTARVAVRVSNDACQRSVLGVHTSAALADVRPGFGKTPVTP